MKRSSPVTFALMVIIGIVYVFEMLAGGANRVEVLASMGAIVPDLLARGEYWRLLAAMFLHIGILHLLLNLWALYQLGGVFELLFGSRRFVLTYFSSGIVASIASALFTRGVAAGASGAIFGILGALIVSIRRSPRFRSAAWSRGLVQQLVLWAGINIVIGFSPGIDNAAHMGGFITGLVLGLIPHHVPPPPPGEMVLEAQDQGAAPPPPPPDRR